MNPAPDHLMIDIRGHISAGVDLPGRWAEALLARLDAAEASEAAQRQRAEAAEARNAELQRQLDEVLGKGETNLAIALKRAYRAEAVEKKFYEVSNNLGLPNCTQEGRLLDPHEILSSLHADLEQRMRNNAIFSADQLRKMMAPFKEAREVAERDLAAANQRVVELESVIEKLKDALAAKNFTTLSFNEQQVLQKESADQQAEIVRLRKALSSTAARIKNLRSWITDIQVGNVAWSIWNDASNTLTATSTPTPDPRDEQIRVLRDFIKEIRDLAVSVIEDRVTDMSLRIRPEWVQDKCNEALAATQPTPGKR